MSFDLNIWKAQYKIQLSGWRERMKAAGAKSVYYFITASAFLPIAQAFQNREIEAFGFAAIASGIGANLLANIVQNWRDEADAAAKLQAAVQADPDLQSKLDALLQELDAIAAAENTLSEADKIWFTETLQAELPRLGSSISYTATATDGSAIAQGAGAKAVAKNGILIEGGVQGDVIINSPPPDEDKPPQPATRQQYLDHLIAAHQHLRLQGISAGSQPLSVSLEKVYVSLTAMDQRAEHGKKLERKDDLQDERLHSGALTVAAALQRYRRLVVIGDPGCGKTTLLAYLALTYARQNAKMMTKRLVLGESDYLPIILPLRNLGYHLRSNHPDAGKDGPELLLRYLYEYFATQKIILPDNFFETALENGHAIILLDGMDEVADKTLRTRIARLIEQFTVCYDKPRYVVTSRVVGYEGAARIGKGFGLAKVRDFNPAEVRQFVYDWTRAVEATLAGDDSPEILRLADAQAKHLIDAIESNPRAAELAVNPLLLTVIALVHRYRDSLPGRRSELYEEAVEVLLGNWDAAKPGMPPQFKIGEIKLDSGDRRSLLEPVAFWMHARNLREIELDDLRPLLLPTFENLVSNGLNAAQKAVDLFLKIINERSGMLVERGTGIYGFAHLTFQEYLAARALADHADSLASSLQKLADPWWREVLLLQAGYLSTQGKRRVSELIAAMMNADTADEPEPHHHLLLAAECLFDVGAARVEGDLLGQVRARLKKHADIPLQKGDKDLVLQKVTAMNALARLESGQIVSQFWKPPWGEPQWVTIPAGEFWMGSEKGHGDEKPIHRLHLPEYQIARVPITNAQYLIYVRDSGANAPEHWRGGEIPKGLEKHPVTRVSWHDTLKYCEWLSKKVGDKTITLPSEAEWEKAARGAQDQREYPWGDDWKELHANTSELGLNETTPVGLFLNGASPYDVLDLSGNVREWTRNLWKDYPYVANDGRESMEDTSVRRVLRGGAFYYNLNYARCAYRPNYDPHYRYDFIGFRVVVVRRFSHSS